MTVHYPSDCCWPPLHTAKQEEVKKRGEGEETKHGEMVVQLKILQPLKGKRQIRQRCSIFSHLESHKNFDLSTGSSQVILDEIHICCVLPSRVVGITLLYDEHIKEKIKVKYE